MSACAADSGNVASDARSDARNEGIFMAPVATPAWPAAPCGHICRRGGAHSTLSKQLLRSNIYGAAERYRSHIGPMRLDPIETFLSSSRWAYGCPSLRWRSKSRPHRVLALMIDD